MFEVKQGDILKVENIKGLVCVVSNDFFNKMEAVIVCPIVKEANDSVLHIEIEIDGKSMYVLTEQLKYLDLCVRGYRVVEHSETELIMEVSDIIQGIFEYI